MNINNFFNIDERLMQLDEKILAEISPRFKETDDITEYNQLKMLSAFIKNGVTESAFAGSTGYGYDDRGREILERVMADAMGAGGFFNTPQLRFGYAHLNGGAFRAFTPGR